MDRNLLGDYVRARRVHLGLTQEGLAERVSDTSSQADISRLERGHVAMPHRERMEELAAALNVSLGALLVGSGWLTADEGGEVDRTPDVAERQKERDAGALLIDLAAVQIGLQMLMDRVAAIERSLLQSVTVDEDGTGPALE